MKNKMTRRRNASPAKDPAKKAKVSEDDVNYNISDKDNSNANNGKQLCDGEDNAQVQEPKNTIDKINNVNNCSNNNNGAKDTFAQALAVVDKLKKPDPVTKRTCTLIRHPVGKQSIWWEGFYFYPPILNKVVDTRIFAVCKICFDTYKGNTEVDPSVWEVSVGISQTPSHLKEHMYAHHRKIHDDRVAGEIEKERKGNEQGKLDGVVVKTNVANVEEKLLNFITDTYQPPSLVEAKSFREYGESLNHKIHHYNRHTITYKLGERAIGDRAVLKKLFGSGKVYIYVYLF